MSYVGNPLATAFAPRVKQDLTGQSGTSFTLSHAVSSANDLSVYINHVRQEPTTAYTVDYTTLTTTGSVASTDDFYIIFDELALQSIAHDEFTAMKATSGTFTGAITTTQLASSGPVSGTTGTFSGAISGTELTANDITLNTGANSLLKLQDSTGTQVYQIKANVTDSADYGLLFEDGAGNDIAKFLDGGECLLTHNHNTKFQTTSTGATVTGTLTATTLAGTLSTAAQTNITSVGTLTGLTTAGATISASNPNLNLSATADGGEGAIQFKDDQGNVDGKIAYRTDYAGNTDNYMTFQTSGTEKVRIDTNANVSMRNANTTGPTLYIGTTSTSVANGGYIGGIMFDASTANTGTARIQALSNGQTDAGATGSGADFSFECRNNNASFTEKARIHGSGEFTVTSQPHFIGGRQGTTGSSSGYTAGTGQNMICNVSQDNTGSYYNTGNGEFTCPVTGVYQLNFHGFLRTSDATNNYSIQIALNSSVMQIAYFAHVTGNNTYMSYSTAIRAAATNVITVKLMSGHWYSSDWRYFGKSIYLLG